MTCQVDIACGSGAQGCAASPDYHGVAMPACSVATLDSTSTTCKAGALTAVGSCAADVSGVNNPASPTVESCSLPSHASCGAESFCVAESPVGGSGPCISSAGDKECPANYPKHQLVYDNFDDQRKCTLGTCKCLPTTGACVVTGNPAGVQARVGGCGNASFVNIPLGAVCTTIPNAGGGSTDVIIGMTLAGVAYSQNTAQPCQSIGTAIIGGDAAGEGPVTICCM